MCNRPVPIRRLEKNEKYNFVNRLCENRKYKKIPKLFTFLSQLESKASCLYTLYLGQNRMQKLGCFYTFGM